MTKTNVSRRNFLGKSPVAAAAVASMAVAAMPVAVAAGLIDVAKVRAALPRLFSGSWAEIMGELLQNAQRAGAKNVYADMTGDGLVRELTFRDDGCGISDGAAGFQKLLAIGASGWDAAVMANQSPLGLGLHALLAHEQVLEVELRSGGLAIQIDRNRWWNDEAYYSQWQSLLRPASGDGFTVRAKLQFNSVSDATYDPTRSHFSSHPLTAVAVAAGGYQDLLAIHVNGGHVVGKAQPGGWLLSMTDPYVFDYTGCQVRVGLPPAMYSPTTLINWYGQEITLGGSISQLASATSQQLAVEIIVRNGQPFTMQSPSRKGPVDNQAWRDFCNAVSEKCCKIVSASSPPSVKLLLAILSQYPKYNTVSKWLPVCKPGADVFTHVVSYVSLRGKYVFLQRADPAFENWPDRLSDDVVNDAELQAILLGEVIASGRPVVVTYKQADPSRVNLCSLSLELQDPFADVDHLAALKFFAAAKLRVLNQSGVALVVLPVSEPLAIVTETSAWDIDQVEGVIVAPSAIVGLESQASQFFAESDDYESSSREQQSADFDMTVAVLLAALRGHTDTLPADTQLTGLLQVLRAHPNAVLRPVWEGTSSFRAATALELVEDGVVVRTITIVY